MPSTRRKVRRRRPVATSTAPRNRQTLKERIAKAQPLPGSRGSAPALLTCRHRDSQSRETATGSASPAARSLPQPVHQVALIVLRRLLGARPEHDEGRRPRLGLRHVAQLEPPPARPAAAGGAPAPPRTSGSARRWRPACSRPRAPAAPPAAAAPRPAPVRADSVTTGMPFICARLVSSRSDAARRAALRSATGVPFGQRQHAGAALALDQPGDLQILLVQPLGRHRPPAPPPRPSSAPRWRRATDIFSSGCSTRARACASRRCRPVRSRCRRRRSAAPRPRRASGPARGR